mgnify:CR=1 FL=1
MWAFPEEFDVIVIGAGHAGCEAAHAAAKMGVSIGESTIESHLKKIPDALETRMK